MVSSGIFGLLMFNEHEIFTGKKNISIVYFRGKKNSIEGESRDKRESQIVYYYSIKVF